MVLFWSRCCQNRSLTFDIYHQPLSNVHSVRATTTEKDPASWNFNPKVIRANTIWYKVTLKPCFKFSDTVWRSIFPSDLTLDIFPQTKGDAFMDIFITLHQKKISLEWREVMNWKRKCIYLYEWSESKLLCGHIYLSAHVDRHALFTLRLCNCPHRVTYTTCMKAFHLILHAVFYQCLRLWDSGSY